MEEYKRGKTHKAKDLKLKQSLKRMNGIEKTLSDMQARIQFLLKRQYEEEKKTEKLFSSSVKFADTKITHITSRLKSMELQQKKVKDLHLQRSRIKSIRENDMNNLKQTRLQVSRYKQRQRNSVRDISIQNSEKIKYMKTEQLNKNKERAEQIRKAHLERIQQIKRIREEQKMRKSQESMRKSMGKLASKHKLEKQFNQLQKQGQQINKRLIQKRLFQQKIKKGAKKIEFMKEQKFINLAKSSYHSEDLKPDNEEAVEQSLLRVALSHNNEHPLIFNIR